VRAETTILPLRILGALIVRDGQTLLAIDDMTLNAGRRTVVLGANGAGKTLFLKLCHGLIAPSAGSVRFALDGGRVAGTNGQRKAHAMVFQKPVLLRRSVFANFTHALSMVGHGLLARRRLARAALARYGLAALADRPARVLSGGEQQRLAIARAASLDPELLFLDEPCSALDPTASCQIEDMLRALHVDGVTLVMSTHDLGQARRLADDILFFDRGRLVESGPASAFFGNPKTPEAQAFLESRLFW
jgi:tungstate transport system ATP-binding protein